MVRGSNSSPTIGARLMALHSSPLSRSMAPSVRSRARRCCSTRCRHSPPLSPPRGHSFCFWTICTGRRPGQPQPPALPRPPDHHHSHPDPSDVPRGRTDAPPSAHRAPVGCVPHVGFTASCPCQRHCRYSLGYSAVLRSSAHCPGRAGSPPVAARMMDARSRCRSHSRSRWKRAGHSAARG
jgi:hypothetical protein